MTEAWVQSSLDRHPALLHYFRIPQEFAARFVEMGPDLRGLKFGTDSVETDQSRVDGVKNFFALRSTPKAVQPTKLRDALRVAKSALMGFLLVRTLAVADKIQLPSNRKLLKALLHNITSSRTDDSDEATSSLHHHRNNDTSVR
jgi:hypothetical protein